MKSNYENKIKAEQAVHDALQRELEKAFKNGIVTGFKTACSSVHEKANNQELSPEERISEIIEFCSTALKDDDKENKISNT